MWVFKDCGTKLKGRGYFCFVFLSNKPRQTNRQPVFSCASYDQSPLWSCSQARQISKCVGVLLAFDHKTPHQHPDCRTKRFIVAPVSEAFSDSSSRGQWSSAIDHNTPGSTVLHSHLSVHALSTAANRTNVLCLFGYNINFKLHRVSNVFRLCKGVNTMMLVCLPPRIPSAHPTGRVYLVRTIFWGWQQGGQSLLCLSTVMFVTLISLDAFGVSNSGEKINQ